MFHIPGQIDLNERKSIPLGERIVRNGGALQKYEPAKIESLFDFFLNVHHASGSFTFSPSVSMARLRGMAFTARLQKKTLGHRTSYLMSIDEGEVLDLGLTSCGLVSRCLEGKGQTQVE